MFFLKKKGKKGRRRRKRPGATRLGSSRKGLCANPFFLKKNCCLPHCFFFFKKEANNTSFDISQISATMVPERNKVYIF
jgi:hypothetical protein